MPIETPYFLIVSMEVDPVHEDLFNEVYEEHAVFLLDVPGVRSIRRMKGEPFSMVIGGQPQTMPAPSPAYTAVYEIDGPEVLASAAWAAAAEKGRWATEVRPHTRNRRHALYAVRPPILAG